ncbi:hypothetical protein B6V01_000665 [Methanosarcinales archaeon ex4572_44]|nr:MAG: hypothetical protein B6U67_02830 [Methanosarcinales archaeon ex4484_138]PHP46136.1 MAG: hypothetical protein B6V01_000665 [Methanosarcinales archaeon ex4572_44]RLG26154.1 MAG: hypothetical protein DRN70_03465 [Methanosarcinales archaeon]
MIDPKMKKSIENLLLVFGFSLMFGIIVLGQEFRDSLGTTVGFVLNPLLALPIDVTLFILAAITGVYASIIQKYTMDWDLMKRVQGRMKEFQKEFREAQLANNQQKLKKLEEKRSAMMGEQMEMSKQQFKPMAYISIISLPIFMWAYQVIHAPTASYEMVFPFWGRQALATELIGPIQHWIYWYFICSMPVSQIVRKVLNIGGI